METARRSTVVGVFDNSEDARDAIQALKDMGFAGRDIGILMKDRGDTKAMAEDTGTRAGEGAATGAIGGGILGGLAGWLVGIGALVIPGVGPFIAAGALGAALTGAAVGAGVGAVAGALVGMGIPKEEAEWYEGEVKSGRTLVTVKAEGRYSEVRDVLARYGAYDIQSRSAGTRMGTTTSTPVGTSRGSDRWEDVSSDYRSHWQQRYGSRGGNYRWEDYEPGYRYGWEMRNRPEYRGRSWTQVEPEFRRDWSSRYHDKPWDRFGETVKDAWEGMTDRGPRRYGDTDTARSFDRWEDVSPDYRSHWQQHYGSMGGSYRWEDYEPGYRYGWEMSGRPEYRGRSWAEVEPEFRRDWSTRYHDKPWDRFMDSIRHAWEGMTDRGPRRFDETDTTRDYGR